MDLDRQGKCHRVDELRAMIVGGRKALLSGGVPLVVAPHELPREHTVELRYGHEYSIARCLDEGIAIQSLSDDGPELAHAPTLARRFVGEPDEKRRCFGLFL